MLLPGKGIFEAEAVPGAIDHLNVIGRIGIASNPQPVP
jgi:hypothetical protein